MADSFPGAPDSSGGSFPQGHEPCDEAPTPSSDVLLFRRYRVLRELGRGGMGVVLLAHDTALDIPVAVKLVPDLVVKDTEAVADLRKEVLRGMALNHDAVVRTHHFEKDDSGAGIVMEFVEGNNLTELKTAQPGGCFDPEQILPWLEQLCAVLDYAHREKRIIHRDLKPRNIMLTRAGRIKVADFGIAAVISDSMSRHSMEGKVSGTLSYMSPQQAEGKRPSHLDDIHALGATIYELLTGKPPFFRGNQASIYQQIIHVVPPSMAARREELDVPGKAPLPPQWEETIAACLAKDPAERPKSAGEVLARLKEPHSRHPLPILAVEPASTLIAPQKSTALWLAAIVVAGLLTGAVAWWQVTKTRAASFSKAVSFPGIPAPAPTATPTPSAPPKIGARIAAAPVAPVATPAPPTPPPVPTPAPTPAPLVARTVFLPVGAKVSGFEFAPPFGYIDQTGKSVLPPQFDNVSPFVEGLACVGKENRRSYIDQTGRMVIPIEWDHALDFSEGLANVGNGPTLAAKWGYIDRTGKVAIALKWDEAHAFAEGLAAVRVGDHESGRWGYIDRTGKIVIPPRWVTVYPFSEERAVVHEGDPLAGRYGYIDRTGQVSIPLDWEYAERFTEGLGAVCRRGRFGYVDRDGKVAIEPEWDEAGEFAEGLAPVLQGTRWGFIDKTSRLTIPAEWHDAKAFADGFAMVMRSSKHGLIDKTGKVVVPVEWDAALSERFGPKGPTYYRLIKQIAPGKALAVYLGPDLKEIWRAELPQEKEP